MFWLHFAQSHVGVSVVMMARPIVTQEAWKNNHHVENAGEDDGDDHIETGTKIISTSCLAFAMFAKLAMLKCKSIYKIDEIRENLILIM